MQNSPKTASSTASTPTRPVMRPERAQRRPQRLGAQLRQAARRPARPASQRPPQGGAVARPGQGGLGGERRPAPPPPPPAGPAAPSSPAPVRAEMPSGTTPPISAGAAARSQLVRHHQRAGPRPRPGSPHRAPRRRRRPASSRSASSARRRARRTPSASISSAGLAQPGGVGQRHRHAGQVQPRLHDVARGAGPGRDDRRLPPGQRVQQRRLAGIRRAEDGDQQPLPQPLAAAAIGQMRRDLGPQRRAPPRATASSRPARQVLLLELDEGFLPRQQPRSAAPPSRHTAWPARPRPGAAPGGAGPRSRRRSGRRCPRPRSGPAAVAGRPGG